MIREIRGRGRGGFGGRCQVRGKKVHDFGLKKIFRGCSLPGWAARTASRKEGKTEGTLRKSNARRGMPKGEDPGG